MPGITAIEFDGDTCAIARTTVRGGVVTASAAELLNPTSFPGTDAFVSALRNTRRTLGLPRRCRVVLWGLPDGASPKDPGAAAALAPLTNAGFKVERVVTPCNALGALSRLKALRDADAACWVAINTSSVAIVAIRPGQQIYARSFGWDSTVGSSGSQARLLQRYSLVAFLAPEIKRAMAAARTIGFPVRTVITCGNLPDLRSLTMPLIEELDVEVETLDSLDGLVVSAAPPARLTELAAAIRLACAGVLARRTRPWDISKRAEAHRHAVLVRAGAAAAVLAALGGGYMLYDWWRTAPASSPAPVSVSAPAHVAPAAGRSTVQPTPPAATAGRTPPPATDAQPAPVTPAPVSPAPVTPTPAPVTPAPAPATPAPAPRPAPVPQPAAAELLKDPIPRVTAILISNDRRFATIADGRVVGIGDSIGRRVVVGIDERTVTLREPSGARVRIGLGGRSSAAR